MKLAPSVSAKVEVSPAPVPYSCIATRRARLIYGALASSIRVASTACTCDMVSCLIYRSTRRRSWCSLTPLHHHTPVERTGARKHFFVHHGRIHQETSDVGCGAGLMDWRRRRALPTALVCTRPTAPVCTTLPSSALLCGGAICGGAICGGAICGGAI